MITTNSPAKVSLTKKAFVFLLLSLFLLWVVIDLIISNTAITVSKHTMESDNISSPVRLVLVTDLHQKEFGKNNARLIEKIKEQDPDLILTLGDLISDASDKEDGVEYIRTLISQLCEIAPVYSCLGNQEKLSAYPKAYEAALSSGDAVLLELSTEDITVNGNKIRLGGISYYREWDEESNAYLQEYISSADDSFTLLLCHHPELFLWGIRDYPIELMVSGHTHGGMVRLPFVGALFAPDQGKFPDYAGGFYNMGTGYLAVCKGLGSSPEILPRFHNPPEIMVIDLV